MPKWPLATRRFHGKLRFKPLHIASVWIGHFRTVSRIVSLKIIASFKDLAGADSQHILILYKNRPNPNSAQKEPPTGMVYPRPLVGKSQLGAWSLLFSDKLKQPLKHLHFLAIFARPEKWHILPKS